MNLRLAKILAEGLANLIDQCESMAIVVSLYHAVTGIEIGNERLRAQKHRHCIARSRMLYECPPDEHCLSLPDFIKIGISKDFPM